MVQAQETMARDPSVNKLFWNELRQMIDSQAEWAVNLGRKTAIERIAYLFCEMTERIGRVATGGPSTCEMPLTQVDIADSTGLTPVHVNRVLQ
ncbi:Crp/Fnr family transcriptional regulator, partial [Streptococcus suis]